jgi:hypothetical protein
MPRHPAAIPGRLDDAGDGLLKASSALGRTVLRTEVTDVLDDFKRLTTDEAKARFADHFLSRTAHVMDEIWPTFYELLKRIEDGELYKKPEYLGGDRTFGSFKEYFEQRVGRPYETWAELESTYRFAQRFAPDLLKKAFNLAKGAKERATQAARAIAEAVKEELKINKGPGRLTDQERSNNHIMMITDGKATGYATSAVYLTRRIARDRPDILERMASGEYRSIRAAALDAGIAPDTQSVRMDDADSAAQTLRKHMSPGVLAELIAILTSKEN